MKIQTTCKNCSKSFETTKSRVQAGRGRHCSKECASEALKQPKTHGHVAGRKQSPTYLTWVNMVRRCTYPGHDKYHRYGAVGVTVCEEWLTFENFLADMGERPAGCTIDRIDGTLGYHPKNCRWANIKTQQRNTKANVFVEYQGERRCISEWAEIHGLDKTLLAWRLRNGWPVQEALLTKPRRGNRIRSGLHT